MRAIGQTSGALIRAAFHAYRDEEDRQRKQLGCHEKSGEKRHRPAVKES